MADFQERLIASRSAAFILDCQRAPFDLKAATISASRRIVVDTFGEASGGRPRLAGAAASLSFHGDLDRSGASSGSIQAGADNFLFAGIGLPHADDATRSGSLRPNHNDHASVELSSCDEAGFAIVAPRVRDRDRCAGEDLIRQRHVEPSMFEDRLTF